jgi:hypothetical protein
MEDNAKPHAPARADMNARPIFIGDHSFSMREPQPVMTVTFLISEA